MGLVGCGACRLLGVGEGGGCGGKVGRGTVGHGEGRRVDGWSARGEERRGREGRKVMHGCSELYLVK